MEWYKTTHSRLRTVLREHAGNCYRTFLILLVSCCIFLSPPFAGAESGLPLNTGYTHAQAGVNEGLIRFSKRNIFEDDSGVVTLNIADAGKVTSGVVNVYDEQGNTVSRTDITNGMNNISIELPTPGSYKISASVSYVDKMTAVRTVTAAVAGKRLDERVRGGSFMGLWNVSADTRLVETAGGLWTRRMWSLKGYKEDHNGKPIPFDHKKKPMEEGVEWIGTFAWGLPSYLTGVEADKGALYPPRDWDKLRLLVERFANDVPEFPSHFEVYNEPLVHWKGTEKELVRFISTVAGAIKSVHPDTVVLAPTLYEIDVEKLKRLIEHGLLDGIDGLSIHAYVNGTPPEAEFIERVRRLKSYLASIGRAELPVHITEFGWSTGQGTWQKPVDELTQARYLSRAFALLSTEEVDTAVYFCLLYTTGNAGEAGFSILNQDKSPKPAYAAYANAARRISARTGKGRWLRVPPSGNVVLLKKGDTTELVAWDTGAGSSLYAGLVAHNAVDMTGRPVNQGPGPFELSASPIFVNLPDASLFDMRVSGPITLKNGGSAPVQAADMRDKVFSITNKVLHVSPDAPARRYVLLAPSADGWQALPVEVLEGN